MDRNRVKINLNRSSDDTGLSNLSLDQIIMIDEAISFVGDFGEVRLVIDRGQLHYLVTQKSYNARVYQPGMIINGIK
jgi:hypothetical protein